MIEVIVSEVSSDLKSRSPGLDKWVAVAKGMESMYSTAPTMEEVINKFKSEYSQMLTLFKPGAVEFKFAIVMEV